MSWQKSVSSCGSCLFRVRSRWHGSAQRACRARPSGSDTSSCAGSMHRSASRASCPALAAATGSVPGTPSPSPVAASKAPRGSCPGYHWVPVSNPRSASWQSTVSNQLLPHHTNSAPVLAILLAVHTDVIFTALSCAIPALCFIARRVGPQGAGVLSLAVCDLIGPSAAQNLGQGPPVCEALRSRAPAWHAGPPARCHRMHAARKAAHPTALNRVARHLWLPANRTGKCDH